MQYLQEIQSIFESTHLGSVMSCTEAEIVALETAQGKRFPLAYREFLLWMGQGTTEFWRGSRAFLPRLSTLTQQAKSILRANRFPKALPKNSFVFWMHQGYQFLFFDVTEDEDPPIHYYNEAEHERDFHYRFYPSFSEFLAQEVIGHAQLKDKISSVSNGIYQIVPTEVPIHPRDYDVEKKLLAHLYQTLPREVTSQAKTVEVELADDICISCLVAIHEFHRQLPDWKLEFKIYLDEDI